MSEEGSREKGGYRLLGTSQLPELRHEILKGVWNLSFGPCVNKRHRDKSGVF